MGKFYIAAHLFQIKLVDPALLHYYHERRKNSVRNYYRMTK